MNEAKDALVSRRRKNQRLRKRERGQGLVRREWRMVVNVSARRGPE